MFEELLNPWPTYRDRATITTWHTKRGIPSIGWIWIDRSGVRHVEQYHVPVLDEEAREATRQLAKAEGYPGHAGGWWNYFVDDARAWLERRGWVSPRDSDTRPKDGDAKQGSTRE
jgi:hypothetical protein